MVQVNVQQAKKLLSELLIRSEAGEEIVIARAGRPVARLVPVEPIAERRFGVMSLTIAKDFDEPLPDTELATWQ